MITTYSKFCASGDEQTIFVKVDGKKAIGFIKIGYKKLFIRNRMNALIEMKPLSVLDFYVSEKC